MLPIYLPRRSKFRHSCHSNGPAENFCGPAKLFVPPKLRLPAVRGVSKYRSVVLACLLRKDL